MPVKETNCHPIVVRNFNVENGFVYIHSYKFVVHACMCTCSLTSSIIDNDIFIILLLCIWLVYQVTTLKFHVAM